jgi:hypothetical protein
LHFSYICSRTKSIIFIFVGAVIQTGGGTLNRAFSKYGVRGLGYQSVIGDTLEVTLLRYRAEMAGNRAGARYKCDVR